MPRTPSSPARLLLRRLVRPAVALALVATGLGSILGSASAATSWHVDATGDVLVNGHVDDGYPHHVRDVPYADITGVSTGYDATTLRVATSMRSYRTHNGFWQVKIRTSQGYDYLLNTAFVPEPGGSPWTLRRSSKDTPGYFRVACEGLTVTRTERGITAHVPTTCLGRAWRVRVGISAQQWPCFESDPCDDTSQYDDDAFVDARRTADTRLTFGPWVNQG